LIWGLIGITIRTVITTITRATDGNIHEKGVAHGQTCRDPTGQTRSGEGAIGDKHRYLYAAFFRLCPMLITLLAALVMMLFKVRSQASRVC
jgi:hypothetical protein